MSEIKLELWNIGTNIGTRFAAFPLREKIEEQFSSIEKIVLDLTGVEYVSESFADELIGKLVFKFSAQDIRDKLDFISATPFTKTPFWKALKERAVKQAEKGLTKE